MKTKDEQTKYWTKMAQELVGRTIVAARYMDNDEASNCGWEDRPVVLQLDTGALLFPQSDDEGNAAGALICYKPDGTELGLPVLST